MPSIPKTLYINKLADIVDEFNNTYHSTFKIKPVDVKSSIYIDFAVEINDKDTKFEVGNHVTISKHKSIFAEGYTSNWSEKVFVIKKVKNTVP